MPYSQGDIVLVPFPFSDLKTAKVRPAIIVSGKQIQKTQDVILAALTTNIRNDHFSFVIQQRSLSHPLRNSEVRCNKLFTCDKEIIHKAISRLDKPSVKILLGRIRDNFEEE